MSETLPDAWVEAAARLGERCLARGVMLAGAESCTGGLIAATLTAVPGSSAWFERSFVTYSNASKLEQLGVSADTLEAHGAVSEETAREMAMGVLRHSAAHIAFAVTGIAGPSGGSAAKPVGLVWFGFAVSGAPNGLHSLGRQFPGDRAAVRAAALRFVLDRLTILVEQSGA